MIGQSRGASRLALVGLALLLLGTACKSGGSPQSLDTTSTSTAVTTAPVDPPTTVADPADGPDSDVTDDTADDSTTDDSGTDDTSAPTTRATSPRPAAPAPTSPPATTPSKSGSCSACATGTVRDAAGNPIPGATVYIVPDGIAGETDATTGPDGTYRINVDDATWDYGIHAYVEKDWQGHKYRMGLQPVGSQLHFHGAAGIRADWVWQLTGHLPGADPADQGQTWGSVGEVETYNPNDYNNIPQYAAGTKLTIRLTPQGLIDGTAGQPIEKSLSIDPVNARTLSAEGYVYDVPVGTYTVTVSFDGAPGQVGACAKSCVDPTYAPSATVTILPNPNAIRPYSGTHGNGFQIFALP